MSAVTNLVKGAVGAVSDILGGGGKFGQVMNTSGSGLPPPPPPPPAPPPKLSPYTKKAGMDAATSPASAAAAAFGGTLLTSPQGLVAPATTGQKTLLGG